MLPNGRALIFTFSRIEVRLAEIERLQSLFKLSMIRPEPILPSSYRFVLLSVRETQKSPVAPVSEGVDTVSSIDQLLLDRDAVLQNYNLFLRRLYVLHSHGVRCLRCAWSTMLSYCLLVVAD